MTLEVIGAGFGRTGTLTLKTALEQLGFGPCHHMTEILGNQEQVPFWNRAADGEPVDWDELYGSYRATVDWPGCYFYAELADRYPRAKVILTTRDPERWYNSMCETIFALLSSMGDESAGAIADDFPMRFAYLLIAQKTFNFDYSKDNAIAIFERHNARVQQSIPAERLLVFDVAQGWEPLCAFLGVPVPAEPFPRSNDRLEFQEHAQRSGVLPTGRR